MIRVNVEEFGEDVRSAVELIDQGEVLAARRFLLGLLRSYGIESAAREYGPLVAIPGGAAAPGPDRSALNQT